MLGKLPFVAGIFWKTLTIVVVLVIVAWVIAVKGFGYTMIPPDYVGSVISTILLAYLVHLWLLPAEELQSRSDQHSSASDDTPGI